MAEKNDFIVHLEYSEAIQMLPMEERGQLFTAMLLHASGAPESDEMGIMAKMLYSIIAPRMDADSERYAEKCEQRAEAAKKRWAKKEDANASSRNAKTCEGNAGVSSRINSQCENMLTDTDTDTDIDTDTVSDIDTGINTDTVPDIETDRDKEKDSPFGAKKEKRRRFTPPSLAEVEAYCRERGNDVDPHRFMDFYQANGWKQGKGKPVVDWKACVRTWERNQRDGPSDRGNPYLDNIANRVRQVDDWV